MHTYYYRKNINFTCYLEKLWIQFRWINMKANDSEAIIVSCCIVELLNWNNTEAGLRISVAVTFEW